MMVRALKNVIYKGRIYNAGSDFEVDEDIEWVMKRAGLIEAAVMELPPMEVKRKK